MEDVLRQVPLFADLSEAEQARLFAQGDCVTLEPGQPVLTPGRPVEHVFVVLEGAVQVVSAREGCATLHATLHEGATFAEASALVGVPFPGTARAVERARLFRLGADAFRTLVRERPALAGRILQAVEERDLRRYEALERQEKLAALGRHAAGLAHELNNPATAGRRASEQLAQALAAKEDLLLKLDARGLTAEQKQALLHAYQDSVEQGKAQGLDPLARSDAEEALAGWLEEHDVEDAWNLAPTLLDAGLGTSTLRPLAERFPADLLPEVLAWLEASVRVRALLGEVCQSTRRLSELARAVKSYAHTDTQPQSGVDVHQGLESTLVMLGYKLKHGVEVTRNFDRNLPRITANPSELNQVWTNLLDNAIDAMKGRGHLEVRTSRDGDWLRVDIIDDGPGIPPDVLPRIFEPFFTTKPAGEGTGLGLDISHRIITESHHGDVRVESRPGHTDFQVRLPLHASTGS